MATARSSLSDAAGAARPPSPARSSAPRHPPRGEVSNGPFTEVDGPGTYDVAFTDATCPRWAVENGCVPAEARSSYDLFFQIPGGDAAGSGTLCITSLRAL